MAQRVIPKKCGDAVELRCISLGKDKWNCSLFDRMGKSCKRDFITVTIKKARHIR